MIKYDMKDLFFYLWLSGCFICDLEETLQNNHETQISNYQQREKKRDRDDPIDKQGWEIMVRAFTSKNIETGLLQLRNNPIFIIDNLQY
ncbi:hypothetical protein HCN44_009844 [Aphidius gifuensis]|uniref:Uncharacterized protein n=1 Tax=Aphidius gifuensis TaxID=684658 RepID=A0A835CTK0_APHGI|nr:hypothetical protein HCN44_009844 [Aphidius gifuensis]